MYVPQDAREYGGKSIAWSVTIHDKGHHIHGALYKYGSAYTNVGPISGAGGKKGLREVLEIRRKEVTYLNDERTPCQSNRRSEEISTCIQHYIESTMGCQLPWQTNNNLIPKCIHSNQYEEFFKKYVLISNQKEASIAKITRCLPSCKRNEYEFKVVNSIKAPANSNGKRYFSGIFYYPSGEYQEKTYYYTYEFPDYIADIGGYLGLLLGYSILNFYDGLKYLIKKTKTVIV